MFRKTVVLMVSLCALASAYDMMGSRTFLEKNLFYISKGKIGQCKYWSLHMGAHECKLRRKFPGEDTIQVDATMNFDMISSGYVSGAGYSARGKVDCITGFHFATQDTSYKIEIDSIAYAFDYCDKTQLTTGEKGFLRIDAEGKLVRPKKCLLRVYHMVDHYGDKVLRRKVDIPVSAFSFTKTGIRKALAEEKKLKAAK